MHLVIIGGGPAGYTAAFDAARRGMRVTLAEQSSPWRNLPESWLHSDKNHAGQRGCPRHGQAHGGIRCDGLRFSRY